MKGNTTYSQIVFSFDYRLFYCLNYLVVIFPFAPPSLSLIPCARVF